MGRKKKQFIDRSKAQHFHVVHRSQQDVEKIHADDYATPSEFVLIPTLPLNEQRKLKREHNSIGLPAEEPKTKDHINEFGLPNDGYDYSKHLKNMGGGTFISSAGKVVANNPYEEESKGGFDFLPSEVLPGAEEQRQFEAITISENVMDQDMYEALFGEETEGGFEEILDDFVVTASEEPEADENGPEEGFDYDAHIARLLEKSRRQLGNFREEEGEEFPDDPGNFSEHESDIDGEELGGMMGDLHLAPVQPVKEPNKEERAMLEAQFEAALLEYGDSENEEDYLFDEEDSGNDDKPGKIDVEGNKYFEGILDEYLEQAKEDDIFQNEDAPKIKKNNEDDHPLLEGNHQESTDSSWSKLQERFKLKTTPKPEHAEDLDTTQNETCKSKESSIYMDEYEENPLDEYPEDGPDAVEKLLEALPYLKRKEQEKWDCETIISTYTNLDNHPTVLSVPMGKSKPKKNVMDVNDPGISQNTNQPSMIQISKKSGLPLGVLPARMKENASNTDAQEDPEKVNQGTARNKKETKEEKKSRKAKLKEERREKRKEKKTMKQQFKAEDQRAAKIETAQTSVFKY